MGARALLGILYVQGILVCEMEESALGKHVPAAVTLAGVILLLLRPAPTGVKSEASADLGATGSNASPIHKPLMANKLHSVSLIVRFHLLLCTEGFVYQESFYAKLLQETVACI